MGGSGVSQVHGPGGEYALRILGFREGNNCGGGGAAAAAAAVVA